jgi:hypothetical protein
MSAIRLNGTSSGYTELAPPAAAGSNTITLPSSNGSANQFLKNGSTAGTLGWSSMVEDSSGRLLLGTSTASAANPKLQINSTSEAFGTTGTFAIYGSQTNQATGGIITQVIFGSDTASGSGGCKIAHVKGGDNQSDSLTFHTGTTSSTERARITSGGELYIAGTTDQGAYNLQVNGTGVWGAGAYVNGSDKRLKEDIEPLADASGVLQKLRPVSFKYKADYSRDQSTQPGFIAQELQEAMAGQVYLDGVVQQGPEYLNVAYQGLIPVLTKALQEALTEIADLKTRITALEAA